MVDTNDQWIVERTGIRERHVLAKGKGVSDICVEAAKKCLAARGIEPSEVEVIIVGTVTPDMMFPSTACLVQDKIGAKGAWGFDVSAGCSGFVFALQAGVKLVESGAHSKVLVCGADANTRMTDYTDRATCVLFGDGGGAVLIEPAEEGEIGFIDFVHEIDGSGGVSLNLKGGGSLNPPTHETVDKKMHFIHQDGQAVYKFAVARWRRPPPSCSSATESPAPIWDASFRTRPTSESSLRLPIVWACPPSASLSILRSTEIRRRERFRWPWKRRSKKGS